MRDFLVYDLKQVEQLIANYNAKNMVRTPEYAALIRARENKLQSDRMLDLFKSMDLLKRKAFSQEFVSYGDLAEASGLEWTNTLRARMSGPKGHLDRLLDLCRHEDLPLLTSLCVNKQNLGTGVLDSFSLAGFVAGAKRVGRHVDDEKTFLRECQRESFAWGRLQAKLK